MKFNIETAILFVVALTFPICGYAAGAVASVNQVTTWLSGPVLAAIIPTLGGVVELVLRMIPTDKPLSLALFVAALVHSVAGFFEALDQALEKIIPQNLKK